MYLGMKCRSLYVYIFQGMPLNIIMKKTKMWDVGGDDFASIKDVGNLVFFSVPTYL